MRIAIVLALALTTTACPLGDDDGDPGNHVALDQIEMAYKDAYCTYLASCGLFPDTATCLGAALSSSYDLDPNIAFAVRAGRAIYDGSNVKRCFDALAQRSCDRTSQSARVTPTACRDFVRGTLASGEACTIDQECISQDCIGGSTSTTCRMGTCIGDAPPELEPAKLGESCTTVPGCAAGLHCDTNIDICTPLVAEGMSCTVSSECEYGLACTGPIGERTCNPLPAENEACTGVMCRDEGTYCSTATPTPMCKRLLLPTSPCTSSTECSPYFPCNFTTAQCDRGPALGEPCTSAASCFDAGTYCNAVTLICETQLSDGQPCTQSAECASDYCEFTTTQGVCASPQVCF